MNPIYKLRHKIQMLKDFLQLLSTGPVTKPMGTYRLIRSTVESENVYRIIILDLGHV